MDCKATATMDAIEETERGNEKGWNGRETGLTEGSPVLLRVLCPSAQPLEGIKRIFIIMYSHNTL